MKNNGNNRFRLTGGVLFSILCSVKKETKTTKTSGKAKTDPVKRSHSDVAMLTGLLDLIKKGNVIEEQGNTRMVRVSEYKNCRAEQNFPRMQTAEYLDTFNERVTKHYSEKLSEAKAFLDEYTEPERAELFVRRVMLVLSKDQKIPPNKLFYVMPDGTALSKAALMTSESICLDSFLLGMWHFVVMKNADNTEGKETINQLFPKDNNAKKKFVVPENFKEFMNGKLTVYRFGAEPTQAPPLSEDTHRNQTLAEKKKTGSSIKKIIGSKRKTSVSGADRKRFDDFKKDADQTLLLIDETDVTVPGIPMNLVDEVEAICLKWNHPAKWFQSKEIQSMFDKLLKSLEEYGSLLNSLNIVYNSNIGMMRLKTEKYDYDVLNIIREKDIRLRMRIREKYTSVQSKLQCR